MVYYNGGMLWVQNKDVPNDWIEFTKTSRFHDQASIEDLVKKYNPIQIKKIIIYYAGDCI